MSEHDNPHVPGQGPADGPRDDAAAAQGPTPPPPAAGESGSGNAWETASGNAWESAPTQPGIGSQGSEAGPQPAAPFGAHGGGSHNPYSPGGYPHAGYLPGPFPPPHQQPGGSGQPPFGAHDPYGQAAYQPPTTPFGWAPPAPAEGQPARASRLRIGLVGLVAGALIGGGAGAGVVALAGPGGTTTAASGPAAQSVVIKDPNSATAATAAAAKAAPSVVTIYVTAGSQAGSGSGVVLSSDGYVLTNNHVVTLETQQIGTVEVRTADGKIYDATVVGTDPTADLAVVKVNGAPKLTPATFADSNKIQVGDLAVAIGAPLGLSNTVTDGIISATNRAVATGSAQGDATVIDAIQTDAAINPGNSGGALVNAAGEVIGINTAIATVASEGGFGGQQGQSGNIGVGFAIPANTAKRISQQIIKTGSATHAVLGVSARTAVSSQNQDAGLGAQVVQVVPGGPADKAGLHSGDVITAVGDRAISSSTELTAAIRSQPPRSKVTLTVSTAGAVRTVDVTLGEGS